MASRSLLDGSAASKDCGGRLRKRPAVVVALALAFIAGGAFVVAQRTAAENRTLLGLQTVHIATDPPASDFAFVPYSSVDGELMPADLVRTAGRRGVAKVDLRPGDYLVVAKTSDGRFHEVVRYVPRPGGDPPGGFYHNLFKYRKDGTVELPRITIPPTSITEGMTLVSPGASAENGASTESAQREAFFMDTHEFTESDWRSTPHFGRPAVLPFLDDALEPRGTDFAVRVKFDDAMYSAELAGKRLPTAAEYDAAQGAGFA